MRSNEAVDGVLVVPRPADHEAVAPGQEGVAPVLLAALNELRFRSISCCYWKSSRRLRSVLAGEGDVDLLVDKRDQHRAEAGLLQQGFKRFPTVACRDHPAITSFFGFDECSGRLIHLHLHFRLIAGEPLLRNYRIPWEHALLSRATAHPTLPIRILDPVSEAILLTVRASLESRGFDPLGLRDRRKTRDKFAADRTEIAAFVDRASVHDRARELLGEELADLVTDAASDPRDFQDQRALERKIRRHFAPHRTYNAIEARMRSMGRAALWSAGRLNRELFHLPRPWNRRSPGGGCVVALTGVDGSGKSTAVAAIRAWLAPEIDVVPIYFGTGAGRPSLLLLPFKLVLPLVNWFLPSKNMGAAPEKVPTRRTSPLYRVFLTVWALAVAREKQTKLRSARRGASRGLIVITDRYPQNEILSFNDGPMLTRLDAFPGLVRRLEATSYELAHRLAPDLVVKLVVTPETAVIREPDMDPALIRQRIADLQRLVFPGARVVCVDAEQSRDEVIRTIKQEIWGLI